MILKTQRKYTRSYTRNATPGAYVGGSPARQVAADGSVVLATGNDQDIVGAFFNTAAKETNATADSVWDGMTSASEAKSAIADFPQTMLLTADAGVYPYNSTANWVIEDDVFVNAAGQWDRTNPSATYDALENRWGFITALQASGGVTTQLEIKFITR